MRIVKAHEADYIKAWNLICDVSRKEFQKVYDRLDVVIQVGIDCASQFMEWSSFMTCFS